MERLQKTVSTVRYSLSYSIHARLVLRSGLSGQVYQKEKLDCLEGIKQLQSLLQGLDPSSIRISSAILGQPRHDVTPLSLILIHKQTLRHTLGVP